MLSDGGYWANDKTPPRHILIYLPCSHLRHSTPKKKIDNELKAFKINHGDFRHEPIRPFLTDY
jgi:hypothetical protein